MRGRSAIMLAPLLLAACQSMPAVSCENADRVRMAAALALRALDRVCPPSNAKIMTGVGD